MPFFCAAKVIENEQWESPENRQKLLFTHPGYKKVRARLQKGAYLSAGIMSHKIAYRKRKKTVFKRRLEIFIKSYFGRRL